MYFSNTIWQINIAEEDDDLIRLQQIAIFRICKKEKSYKSYTYKYLIKEYSTACWICRIHIFTNIAKKKLQVNFLLYSMQFEDMGHSSNF